jgi:hypothetical protein
MLKREKEETPMGGLPIQEIIFFPIVTLISLAVGVTIIIQFIRFLVLPWWLAYQNQKKEDENAQRHI